MRAVGGVEGVGMQGLQETTAGLKVRHVHMQQVAICCYCKQRVVGSWLDCTPGMRWNRAESCCSCSTAPCPPVRPLFTVPDTTVHP